MPISVDELSKYLEKFNLSITSMDTEESPAFSSDASPPLPATRREEIVIAGKRYAMFVNEFWTSRQRQAARLHEIAYRACFKPQLPRFFIHLFSHPGDVIYDPFAGRGTTVIEAGLMERNIIANDVNPLSKILSQPRFFIPMLPALAERLRQIPIVPNTRAEIDLSMFYHPDTESEIVSLRNYLRHRRETGREDNLDRWIRMVATNRLTGHSRGFFSVYTPPPNQATSAERQRKINARRNQTPEYRNTRELILKKSKQLIGGLTSQQINRLRTIGENALFLNQDARHTPEIPDETIQLTVTSPPFLNVVQYANDNWLRWWFNEIDTEKIANALTVPPTLEKWRDVMQEVFRELYRITRKGGWVAFEVGEVYKGRIKLEEEVIPLGIAANFHCFGVVVNQQRFTKTANIWGIENNRKGTNSNRIVLFYKQYKKL